jgi:TRAP-type C4-dicarboxylate transport system substrate-binding protein
MVRGVVGIVVVGLALVPPPAHAPKAPTTLRMAAIAPEGTSWGRLLNVFGDDVERSTHGRVRVKWLLGGSAGDELTTLEKVRKDELSGLAGAILCQRVAPSLQALEIAGLAQNDDEASKVMRRLRPVFDEESRATPFMFLGLSSGFGHRVLFTRTPQQSLAELRARRFWVYDLDQLEREQLRLMGVTLVPLPIDQAGRAYDEGRVDGFFSVPWAGVAYGYAVKARYFTDLDSMFLPACMILSRATFDRLDDEAQQALLAAGARIEERYEELGRQQHADLLTRVFPREGLRPAPMSPEFRKEYQEAARAASARLAPRFVPLSLVRRVNAILAELRGQPTGAAARAPPPPPR